MTDPRDKIGVQKEGLSDRLLAIALLYLFASIPIAMALIGFIWKWSMIPLGFFVGIAPIGIALFGYLIYLLAVIAIRGEA